MTQPEALRLADWLLDWLDNNAEPADLEAACVNAAAKLRCLYAENNELLEALKELKHVMPIFPKSGEDLIGYKERYNAAQYQASQAIAKSEGKT